MGLKNEQTINKVESETESKKEEVKIDVKKEKTKNEDKESIKKINNVSQEVNEKSVISEKSVEKIQNNLSQTPYQFHLFLKLLLFLLVYELQGGGGDVDKKILVI